MLDIVNTLLPVFSLLLIGFVCERIRLLPAGSASVLNRFVCNLGMPALIFVSTAPRSPEDLARAGFVGGSAAGMLLCFVVPYVFVSKGFKRSHPESGMLSLLACCPNNVFLGLPILAALFPGNGDVVLASTISNILCLPIMLLVMLELEVGRNAAGERGRSVLLKAGRAMLFNPILLSALAGAFFCLSRLSVPEGALAVGRSLGATTTPCALTALGMALGAQLAAGRTCHSRLLQQICINTVKLALQPALTWLCLIALGVEGSWLAMGVILSAMPTATIAYAVSESYDACSQESSRIILINTAASAITIPALILLLRFFAFL